MGGLCERRRREPPPARVRDGVAVDTAPGLVGEAGAGERHDANHVSLLRSEGSGTAVPKHNQGACLNPRERWHRQDDAGSCDRGAHERRSRWSCQVVETVLHEPVEPWVVALLERVETRVAQMRERGEEVRVDDTPEVLTKRLASYRTLTEPLIHYYSERRKLLTVDGMMTIEHVTREINRILAAIGAVEAKASKKAGAVKRIAKGAKSSAKPVARSAGRGIGASKKTAKASPKVRKSTSQRSKKSSRGASASSKARAVAKPRKTARKVTKKRAKA